MSRPLMRRRILLLVLLLCFSVNTISQQLNSQQPTAPTSSAVSLDSPDTDSTRFVPATNSAYIVQVLLGLAFVLILIFAIAWVVNRFGRGTLLASNEMKLIGSLPLGAKERVVVVEVGEQQILLGVTPNNINTLQVFTSPVIDKKSHRELSEFKKKILDIMSKGSAQ